MTAGRLAAVMIVAGFALVLILHRNDGATLGGVGLIVLGALVAAISFDDRTGESDD